MPLYEYYCEPCDGVFELLRPPREASQPQPCPECDEDAKRIVSKQWSAFIFRDGYPRRLPDTGGYWHLGKPVDKPIAGSNKGIAEPEFMKAERTRSVEAEELEAAEARYEARRAAAREGVQITIPEETKAEEQKFQKRLMQNKSSKRGQQLKKKFSARVLEESRRSRYQAEKGEKKS